MRGACGAAALAASSSVFGCGGDDGESQPDGEASATPTSGPRGRVVMALSTLADQSTDPHVTRVANLAPITTSCFEQFSRWDPAGNLVPALADQMEEPPDHMQLVFHLRPDATFWDGSPVTAEDAAWSFERYISVQNGDTYQETVRQQVESVSAPDAATVVVKLGAPTTLRLSFGIINPRGWNIVSRAHYERVGEDEFRRQPMCSGPFKVGRSERLDFVELEAYAGHYERAPKVGSVRLEIVPDAPVRVARLRAGEADFIDGVAGPVREQVGGDAGIQLYESPAAAMATLYFQEPDRAPYNDVRVRKALQVATDQQALISALLGGAGTRSPAAHVFPVTKGYDREALAPQPYDPRMARELLAAAGYGDGGAKVKLWGYDSSSAPLIPRMLEAVAGMWREAGVEVDLEILEAGAYLTRYAAHELGGITALASGAWFDGEALLRTDYLDGQPFSPPMPADIRDDILGLASEFDEERRTSAITGVYRKIVDSALSVTLPWSTAAWAVRRDRVTAWRPYTAWAYPHALETLEVAEG